MAPPTSPASTLQFEPAETLNFDLTSDKTAVATLVARNSGTAPVAFKVQTTAPKRYLVKPNHGVLEASSTVKVVIQVQPKGRAHLLEKEGVVPDRFMVKSQQCPSSFADLEKGSVKYEEEMNRFMETLSGSSLFNVTFTTPTTPENNDSVHDKNKATTTTAPAAAAAAATTTTSSPVVEEAKKAEIPAPTITKPTEVPEVKTDSTTTTSTPTKPATTTTTTTPAPIKEEAPKQASVLATPIVAEPVVANTTTAAPEASKAALTVTTPSRVTRLLDTVSDRTSTVLAKSYFIGLQGFDIVKRVGERVGVNSRLVKVEETYQVVDKVKSTAAIIVDKAVEINERTKGLQERALKYRLVAAGAYIAKGAWSWGVQTFDSTVNKVQQQATTTTTTSKTAA